jgi:hypothetical protein
MNVKARFVFTYLLLFVATVVAVAKDKNAPPQVVEYRDVPIQQSQFQDQKTPSDCTGSWVLGGKICWKVYPIAYQSFNKQMKGINLLINVWGDRQSGIDDFNSGALTIAIDGDVVELPDLVWQSGGDYSLYGDTTVVKDESLLRRIATGSEVWLTVHETVRFSIKLSPRTLLSMNAVLDKYDSLEPTSDHLEQPNALSPVPSSASGDPTLEKMDEEIAAASSSGKELADQFAALQKECPDPKTRSCLDARRKLTLTGIKLLETGVLLFNEEIALIDAGSKSEADLKVKDRLVQRREKAKAALEEAKGELSSIDQELVRNGLSGTTAQ